MHYINQKEQDIRDKNKIGVFLLVLMVISLVVNMITEKRNPYEHIRNDELIHLQGILVGEITFSGGGRSERRASFTLKEFPAHEFQIRGIELSALRNNHHFKQLSDGDTCMIAIDTVYRQYLAPTNTKGRFIRVYEFSTRTRKFLELNKVNDVRSENLSLSGTMFSIFFVVILVYMVLEFSGVLSRLGQWWERQTPY